MKKFNFRLAGFLRIKDFEEKNAWNEVLKQEARTLRIKAKIDKLMEEIHGARKNASLGDLKTSADFHLIEESIRGMNASIELLQKEYVVEMKSLERLLTRHREIKKEAKIIEKLKERKKSEFEEEKAEAENERNVEAAIQSHLRKVK